MKAVKQCSFMINVHCNISFQTISQYSYNVTKIQYITKYHKLTKNAPTVRDQLGNVCVHGWGQTAAAPCFLHQLSDSSWCQYLSNIQYLINFTAVLSPFACRELGTDHSLDEGYFIPSQNKFHSLVKRFTFSDHR